MDMNVHTTVHNYGTQYDAEHIVHGACLDGEMKQSTHSVKKIGTDISTVFFHDFQCRKTPNSGIFPGSNNAFSRTFQVQYSHQQQFQNNVSNAYTQTFIVATELTRPNVPKLITPALKITYLLLLRAYAFILVSF